MAQIKSGKAVVTNGVNTVTGIGVDWSTIHVGVSIFVIKNRAQSYLVMNSVLISGVWTLTLERSYGETSSDVSGLDYAVHNDFTPFLNLPILETGDIETASILARALKTLDTAYAGLGSVSSGGGLDIPFTQIGNDFVIGTALYVKTDGTFAKATTADPTKATVVGIVSETGTNFKLRTSGLLSGLSGLSPGVFYYLRNDVTPIAHNWDISANVGASKILLFQAIASDSIFILPASSGGGSGGANFLGATSSAAGVAGSVPAPTAGQQSFYLRGDGGWALNTPSDRVLRYLQLARRDAVTAPVSYRADGTMVWDPVEANRDPLPITNFLEDLWYRLKRMQLRQINDTPTITELAPASNATSPLTGIWTVPAGLTYIVLEVWSAGGVTNASTLPEGGEPSPGDGGHYARVILPTIPGDTFSYQVGLGGAQTATGRDTWFRASNSTYLVYAEGGFNSVGNGSGKITMAVRFDASVDKTNQTFLFLRGASATDDFRGGYGANGGRGGVYVAQLTDAAIYASVDPQGNRYIDGISPGGGGCWARNTFGGSQTSYRYGKAGMGLIRISY